MKKGNNHINISKLTAFVSIFLVFITVLSLVYVFAEYTKSSRAKRVIATYGTGGMLFSSNKLEPESNTSLSGQNFTNFCILSNPTVILTGTENTEASSDITICNYAQGNPGRVNDSDINYTLYAKLVKVDGTTVTNAESTDVSNDINVILTYKNSTITLGKVPGANEGEYTYTPSYSFSSATLSRGETSTDTCNVRFSSGFNTNANGIRLFLAAIPENGDLLPITAMINTSVRSAQTQSGWSGYFNELGAQSPADTTLPQPMDLDGFNYVITGTGAGTVTLKWQSDKIAINQVFLRSFTPTITPTATTINGVTWSSVTIPVDSDIVNRYDTQFYFVDKNSTDFANWTQVNSYVTCEYTL